MVGYLMSIWQGKMNDTKKPWGHEHSWQAPWGTGGKIICINADKRTSLKYYKMKNEVLLCYSGRIMVEAPDENEFGNLNLSKQGSWFELTPGDLIYIQAENRYRLKALEDSVLIEVTSGGHNGRECVMLEDDFNRNKKIQK